MDKGVFINHSAILSASGEIEFGDGVMAAPGLRIAAINHDMNDRHITYTYGKVTIKKNAWIGMNVTICPGVTIGKYAVVGAGAVVTKDVPDYAVVGGVPAKILKSKFKCKKGLMKMGKKVVVISTSIRANSNSEALAESFVNGALSTGNDVDFISLKDKKIEFCKGCLACQNIGKCVIILWWRKYGRRDKR